MHSISFVQAALLQDWLIAVPWTRVLLGKAATVTRAATTPMTAVKIYN